MNFSEKEIDSIFSILVAILNLGNVEFDDKNLGNSTSCEIINSKYLT